MKRGQVVILGASIGGLYQAAALRRHFERVVLIESDELDPASMDPRQGVAQGRQLHGLLRRGAAIFEKYLPGLRERLVADGATVGEFGHDIRWYMQKTWWSPKPAGVTGLGFTRPFFESHLRRRVLEEPNVRIESGARVRSLLTTDAGKSVSGVELERLATKKTETLEADLVVDCTGRNSKTPAALEAWGYSDLKIDEIDIGLTYVTQVVRLTKDPGWTTCYVSCHPPESKRFGMIMGAQKGLSIFLVGSYLGERPPTEPAAMHEFARTLDQPQLAQAMDHAERVVAPSAYHFKSNLRRRYGQMRRFPEGLAVAGDAVCSFNPIYGQGMTSAALAAELLDAALTKGVDGRKYFAAFQRPLEGVIDQPWLGALANDLRFPEVVGPRSAMLAFLGGYSNHVLSAMHHDAVHRRFLGVLNMTSGPLALFHPVLMGAALAAKVGLIKPKSTFPGPRALPPQAATGALLQSTGDRP